MKVTNSRDGIERTEIRVGFRLSKDDIAWILAYEVSRYGAPERFLKKEIEEKLRAHLRDFGADKLDFRGDYDLDVDSLTWGKTAAEILWSGRGRQ